MRQVTNRPKEQYFVNEKDQITVKSASSRILYRSLTNELVFRNSTHLKLNIDSLTVKPSQFPCKVDQPESGLFQVEPCEDCDGCWLFYYYKGRVVGNDLFKVKRAPNPSLYSYEINNTPETGLFDDNKLNSYHTQKEVSEIREFRLLFDFGTGSTSLVYTLESFEFMIIRDGKVVFTGTNKTGELSKKTKDAFKKIKSGDFLSLVNINCRLGNGKDRRKFNYNLIEVK